MLAWIGRSSQGLRNRGHASRVYAMGMNSSQAARVLLVRAVEENQPDSLASEALLQAAVEAGRMQDESAWLARRAGWLVEHALGPWRALLGMTDALAPSFGVAFLLPFAAGLARSALAATGRRPRRRCAGRCPRSG